MYAILVSIALAIYSLILIDFSLLFQEISVNADMMTSVQALYTAEGAAEASLSMISTKDVSQRNIEFLKERAISSNGSDVEFLTYNEGANTFSVNRKMNLDASDLSASDAFYENNRTVKNGIYLANGQTLDRKTYYGLEPLRAKGFALREVDNNDNFNEIAFEYNQGSENSDLVFEVFAFPREGSNIDFLDFDDLKNGLSSSVKRIVINTRDSSLSGRIFPVDGAPSIQVNFGGKMGDYKDQIRISGFQPLENNYVLHFQTLDNAPTHFKLNAFYQNQPAMLPNMLQTIDVIGATSTGLYQRIKIQRQSEESILPGLNFVHFSDGAINK